MSNPTIVPFIKWVGGKRQIVNKLVQKMPKDYNRFFEPFVGGGALLFHLQPQKAVISDLNEELINAYKVIKNNYMQLREYLLLMEYGHSEEFFTKIRKIDRNDANNHRLLSMQDSELLRAARFIYLNKACYNGMYRVNSSGFFNVPHGKKEVVKTHEWPNLENIAAYLKQTDIEIKKQSFEEVLQDAKAGDFVYFDPPYDYEMGTKGFIQYQKEGFGPMMQIKLAEVCKQLDAKGVFFMVSNHNTSLINECYSGFNINVISAKRIVGGKGASRKNVEEVVITNYEI